MTEPRSVAIYPGSFDPLTIGHEEIVRRALRLTDRLVLAVAHQPSQQKHGLLAVAERLELISEVFAGEPRVEAAAFSGLLVDFARQRGANLIVRGLRGTPDFEYEAQMARTNRSLAPDLDTVFLASSPAVSFISSSLVRQVATLGGDVGQFVSAPVAQRLGRLKQG